LCQEFTASLAQIKNASRFQKRLLKPFAIPFTGKPRMSQSAKDKGTDRELALKRQAKGCQKAVKSLKQRYLLIICKKGI
jgi:hypothetical protein